MIKKIIFVTAFCFSLVCMIQKNTYAQSEKTTIGILPVTYTDGKNYSQFTDAVTTAFSKNKRFILVDRSKINAVQNEKQLQKGEDFIDGSTVQQGKSLGAQFLIAGSLTSYENNGDKCKFSLTLNVIDVATGQTIISDIIVCKGGSNGTGLKILGAMAAGATKTTYNAPNAGDPHTALAKALKSVSGEIDDFVAKNFPASFSIVEIQEKDATTGGATKILIAGGSAFNLQKGDKLKVVELTEKEVDGKKFARKIEIGEIKIIKVEDENFSTCTVKSGSIEINAKVAAKAKLQVITEY